MKKILKLLLTILLMSFLSLTVQASEVGNMPWVLFEAEDPVGDDWGPGTYTYPKYKQFEPYKGLCDLTYFSIKEEDADYILEFSFDEIRDPWRSKYKFSHPLIELYFDNQPGGSDRLFRPGARVKFSQDALWDIMLHITGWWIKVFRPEDYEDSQKTSWSDPESPFDLKDVVVTLKDKVISIRIKKTVLGDISQAKFYLLIGAFDSFGPNYYREIKEVNDDWAFGGATGKYSPRVIDMLVPKGKVQENILQVSPNAQQFVTIPYIAISKKSSLMGMDKLVIWFGVIVIGLLLVIIVKIKSKKDSIHN